MPREDLFTPIHKVMRSIIYEIGEDIRGVAALLILGQATRLALNWIKIFDPDFLPACCVI
jgi:hypothetical protein